MSRSDTKKKANVETLAEGKRRLKEKLLTITNAQLARMIQHIASFVYYTKQDDADQDLTSVAKIRGVLGAPLQHSDRGANFLKMTDLSYKSGWSRACLATPRSMASTSGTCHRASFSRMGAPSTRGWRTACCIKSVSSSASMLIMT